jgi:hypothetical protein
MNQCHFERSASGSFTRVGIRTLNIRTPFVNYFVQNISLVYELWHTEKLKSISLLILAPMLLSNWKKINRFSFF